MVEIGVLHVLMEQAVLKEVTDSEGQVVMFIDEIHTVVGAGATSGSMDASNLLKPMLARGELRCIGATTLNEYKQVWLFLCGSYAGQPCPSDVAQKLV